MILIIIIVLEAMIAMKVMTVILIETIKSLIIVTSLAGSATLEDTSWAGLTILIL